MKIKFLMIIFILMLVSPQEILSAGAGTINITVTIAEFEIIEATVEFRPTVIRRTHRNIQCYIELPNPYRVEDIDVNTVALTEVNGTIIEPPLKTIRYPMIGDYDKNGIADLMVWFGISTLTPLLKIGENTLTVTGKLVDGKTFKGTGTIVVAGHPLNLQKNLTNKKYMVYL